MESLNELVDIIELKTGDIKRKDEKRMKALKRDIKKKGRELIREVAGYYDSGIG